MELNRILKQLRTALPIFIAILAVAFLYSSSLSTLWEKWVLWDQDLAHALPTLGVMLILLGSRDYHSAPIAKKTMGYWLQLIALAGCSIVWYLFASLSISLPAYFLIIILLGLLISSSLSFATLRALTPYLGLLIFTVPIWAELTSLLVNLSSKMVGLAVKFSRLTALIDGNNIFLPSGTIFIADGCSGLRYLIISLLIGYIMALVNHYRLLQSVIVLMLAAGLGLFANWLRIYLLVLIGYLTDMESSLMKDHEMFGWIVFAVILVPTIYFAPVVRRQLSVITIPRPALLPFFLLLIGPLLFYFSPAPDIGAQPLSLQHLNHYPTTANASMGAQVKVEFNSVHETKQVNLDGIVLQVSLFTHIPGSKTEEIVPYIGRIVSGSQWVNQQQLNVTTAGGRAYALEVYRRVGSQNRVLMAKQYIVGQYQTSNYIYAKLIQILAKAAGDNYFGLLILQTNCETDCTDEITRIMPALDKASLAQ